MPKRVNGKGLTANEELALIEKAMAGDMVITVSPATVTPEPTSAAWTRDVVISVGTAAGEVHVWLNKAIANGVSVGDTSNAGTATIASTTLTLVNGMATVTVSGDAQDWLNGETDTLTVANMSLMGYTVTGGTSVETFTS